MSVLSPEEITALLKPQTTTGHGHVSTRNTKHVSWHDTEMRCANKYGLRAIACGSPTYIKILNVPKCMTHAVLQLADMLDPNASNKVELGENPT